MAHIYGKVGESALQKSLEKRENVIWGVVLVLAYGAMGMGVVIGLLFSSFVWIRWFSSVAIVLIFAAVLLWKRRFMAFLDEKFRAARMWHRGYEGERVVGELLEAGLSEKYHVFNDIRFPGRAANIDHIVIGPSGIFVLDTKNWRGTVAWAEDGETLLWNGVPEKKGVAKAILSDALDVHDKLRILTNRDFFIKPILVFPLAKVMPRLNTRVELQQDDYLIDKRLNYIDKRNALSDADAKMAVDALQALFRNNLPSFHEIHDTQTSEYL
jgi:hypothetical protein